MTAAELLALPPRDAERWIDAHVPNGAPILGTDGFYDYAEAVGPRVLVHVQFGEKPPKPRSNDDRVRVPLRDVVDDLIAAASQRITGARS